MDHYSHVTVGYEPGVMIDGKWMIEDLIWGRAANPSEETFLDLTLPTEIRKLCKTQQDRDNPYISCFDVISHQATRYSEEWRYFLVGVLEDENWRT